MHYNLLLVLHSDEEHLGDDADYRMQPYWENYSGDREVPQSDELWYDWYSFHHPEKLVTKDGSAVGFCRLSELDADTTDFNNFYTYADDDFATDRRMADTESIAGIIQQHLAMQKDDPFLIVINYHN